MASIGNRRSLKPIQGPCTPGSELEVTARTFPFYASPILAAGRLYVVSRWSGTFVFAAKPEFAQIAQNQFASDETDFNATLAVSKGELFLRSNQFLYCVANEGAE